MPDLGPLDVLVKLSATGVCGTDSILASGLLGPTRRILGHEGIGRIAQVGSALTDEPSIQVGQRTGVSWVRDVCGHCATCLKEGGELRCLEQFHSGRKIDGTFAHYTIVPSRYLIPVPEGPPDEHLAPITCAGVTAYKALKICGATPGQWIAVSGAGGAVGGLAFQYARSMGYRTIAIDAGDEKGRSCKAYGADIYVDVLHERDTPEAVARATQHQGVSAVLVTVGKATVYEDAFRMLAPFGALVCAGIPSSDGKVTFHPLVLIDQRTRVIGSMVGTRGDIQEAIDLVSRGVVVPEVEVISFDRLADITEINCSKRVSGLLLWEQSCEANCQTLQGVSKYVVSIDS